MAAGRSRGPLKRSPTARGECLTRCASLFRVPMAQNSSNLLAQMMRFLRQFAHDGATPLLILAVIACLYALAFVGLVPYPSALLHLLSARLRSGDWLFISTCSALESTVGINGYFPGAFVILFAMASTHGNVSTALRVFGALCGGAFVGQNVSYIVGRALADQTRRERSNSADVLGALGAFWHPQLGAAYSFNVGRQRMPYARFLAILVVGWSPWNIFWGTLMYHMGRVPIEARSFLGIFAVYLALWLVLALIRTARTLGHPRSPALSKQERGTAS
jgi:membrane protein DedA with SNARE-associated domain